MGKTHFEVGFSSFVLVIVFTVVEFLVGSEEQGLVLAFSTFPYEDEGVGFGLSLFCP